MAEMIKITRKRRKRCLCEARFGAATPPHGKHRKWDAKQKSPLNRNNNMAFFSLILLRKCLDGNSWRRHCSSFAQCPVPMMSLVDTIIIIIIILNIIVESIRPKWLYAAECATHDRPACCCHIQLNADCLVWHDALALTVFDSTIKTSL